MRKGPSPLSRNYLHNTSTNLLEVASLYQNYYRQKLTQMQMQPARPSIQETVHIFTNGVLLGNPTTNRGLFLEDEGLLYFEVEPLQDHPRTHMFVFPDLTICLAQTSSNDELHDRCVFLNEAAFMQCYNLRKGKFEGVQYSYVPSIRQFTKSLYKNDRLSKIVRSEFLEQSINPITMIEDKETVKLILAILAMDFLPLANSVTSIRIGDTMRYYGQVKAGAPNGYGCILSVSEMFSGEFYNGLLHGLGRIRFSNGDVCTGGFEEGMCKNIGKFVTADSVVCRAGDTTITETEFDDFLKRKGRVMQMNKETDWGIQPSRFQHSGG